MAAQTQHSPTISLKQVAKLLRYHEGHVRRLISEGHLKSKQRGPGCPHRFDLMYAEQKKAEWGR